jgi:hypothetical protein
LVYKERDAWLFYQELLTEEEEPEFAAQIRFLTRTRCATGALGADVAIAGRPYVHNADNPWSLRSLRPKKNGHLINFSKSKVKNIPFLTYFYEPATPVPGNYELKASLCLAATTPSLSMCTMKAWNIHRL